MSAVEAARQADGKFGTQEHGRPSRGLVVPSADAEFVPTSELVAEELAGNAYSADIRNMHGSTYRKVRAALEADRQAARKLAQEFEDFVELHDDLDDYPTDFDDRRDVAEGRAYQIDALVREVHSARMTRHVPLAHLELAAQNID